MNKFFLHVGCGPQTKKSIKGFDGDDWEEVRFDIDENVKPDIIGSLTDMSEIADSSIDAIYSSHNIEHLHYHEVFIALSEFRRVLKDDGFVVLTCPDLQSVCEAVVNNNILDPLYISDAGPISPLDILYGHRGFIEAGNFYMAHKCGFTYASLESSFFESGFVTVYGGQRKSCFDLWILAFKNQRPISELEKLSLLYFPLAA